MLRWIQIQAWFILSWAAEKSEIYVGDSAVGGEWRIHKIVGHILFLLIFNPQAIGYMLFSETELQPLSDPNLSSAWFQHEGKCAAFPGDPPEHRAVQLVCLSFLRHWLINLLHMHLPACTSCNSAAVAPHHQWVWEPLKSVSCMQEHIFCNWYEIWQVGMSTPFGAELYN